MSKIFLLLIDIYQRYFSFDGGLLSALAPGGACKFEVSCSEYMRRQIISEGAFKGVILGLNRVWRCR